MTVVEIAVGLDRVVWQAVCDRCNARYAVTHSPDADAATHPRYCVFCASRASFRVAPAVPAATF